MSSYSYADYTAAVAIELTNDGFYRYPKDLSGGLAFASMNSDGNTVMVGDILLLNVTMCANSSFTGNMKSVCGHSIEECFPYYKFVFALPVLENLNYFQGVEDYIKLVQKPEKFEIEMKELLSSDMLAEDYTVMFQDKFLLHYGAKLFSGLKEELSKRPDEKVQQLVDKYVPLIMDNQTRAPRERFQSYMEVLDELQKLIMSVNPKMVKAIGGAIPLYSFKAAWEDENVRVPLVALYRGNIMAKQPICSRLYMSLLLVEGENRMSEVSPFDDIWGYKLKVAPEHKDIHGNIGYLLYDKKERERVYHDIVNGPKKLQEKSYDLLAAIVKDKAGAEELPAAKREELTKLREAMLKRGVPASYLDFDLPESVAAAVRELTPEVAAEAIDRIHKLLPIYPEEEVEKKLAAVVVKKAELDAIKKAELDAIKKAEEEAKQKTEDDKIALLIAETIVMEKEEAAKKRKADEEETECNGRTLSCRA